MRPGALAHRIHPALPVCMAALLIGGCASSDGATQPPAPGTPTAPLVTPATTPATTPAVEPSPTAAAVTVTHDLRFASSAPDLAPWSEPLLDVYAPTGGRGLPLVVMLPPHGIAKDDAAAFAQLANAVAAEGAVVVVANWSQLEDPPETFEDPAALETIASLGQSVAGCAVSYAAANAAELGADPSRLVLLGELYGGNIASMVALGVPDPLPGCDAATAWSATGVVGWNADWLAAMPAWDQLGPDAARAVAALSPWPSLADAPRIPVRLVVGDFALSMSGRCDDRDADWMAWRDPSGAMRSRLDEVGAFEDGCQDLGDGARATAAEMQALGIPAEVVELTDRSTRTGGGGYVESLGAADLATLADTVLEVAGAAPAQP